MKSKGRVLGVDLGERRIGLAISDPTRILATPLSILERANNRDADHAAILSIAREYDVNEIVVGWPRSLSGRDGPAAQNAREETELLKVAAGENMMIEMHDERFSTAIADDKLRAAKSKKKKSDDAAAAVFLQAYLDGVS